MQCFLSKIMLKKLKRVIFQHFSARSADFFQHFIVIFQHFLSARSAEFFFSIIFQHFWPPKAAEFFFSNFWWILVEISYFLAFFERNLSYFLAFFSYFLAFFVGAKRRVFFQHYFLAFFSARSAEFFFNIFFFKTLKKTLILTLKDKN